MRLAVVPDSDADAAPLARKGELLSKLEDLKAQSRRYLAELNRINEEVERLQARVANLGPGSHSRGGNAARYPREQEGAA
jgi:hypothetical protein